MLLMLFAIAVVGCWRWRSVCMVVLIVVVLIVFVIITNNLKSGAYGRMFYDCTKSQYSLLLDLDCEPFVYFINNGHDCIHLYCQQNSILYDHNSWLNKH